MLAGCCGLQVLALGLLAGAGCAADPAGGTSAMDVASASVRHGVAAARAELKM